jgi:hypothetical protein
LAEKASDGVVSGEPEILEEITLRIFGVMYRVANLSCDYIKRGRWSSPQIDKLLMIAARTIGGPAYPEMIEEMDGEFSKVIEDFHHIVSGEALRLANETGKLSFSRSADNWSSGVRFRASRARLVA